MGYGRVKLTANAPENRPGPNRKFHLPTIHFQVRLLLVSGRVWDGEISSLIYDYDELGFATVRWKW